jgi:hypothetical protein
MTSSDIDQYMQREYAIECPRMVLRQNTENDPASYEGLGSILSNGRRQPRIQDLRYREGCFRSLARIRGPKAPKAGEIIPSDEYLSFEAESNHPWKLRFR